MTSKHTNSLDKNNKGTQTITAGMNLSGDANANIICRVEAVGSDLIRGNQLCRSGELESAVVAYQNAILKNPSFHWSHYQLGEALCKLEN